MPVTILLWPFVIVAAVGIGASMENAVKSFNSYRDTMTFGKLIEGQQSDVMFAERSLRQRHHGRGYAGLNAAQSGLGSIHPANASAYWCIALNVARRFIVRPIRLRAAIMLARRSAAISLSQERIAAPKVTQRNWRSSATGGSAPFADLMLWLRFTIFSHASATAAAVRTPSII